MRLAKLGVPSAVLALGLLACVATIQATTEYGKKEKKSCTTCHAKVSKDSAEMTKKLKPNRHMLQGKRAPAG
ncbi:MAG: hypothetical protein ABI806_17295 [Candidatus Solibacter sp.]